MKRLVVCLLVAACGGVDNPRADAGQPDAPVDSAADAGDVVDAGPGPCMIDSFDGSVLGTHWSVLAGTSPTTYDVSGSRLLMSDAPFATTPSMPATSWIYDLDTDKGNQMAWSQQIGGEDFTVTADLSWSSTTPELTLGGVAVSDAQGTIEAMAGAYDPSVNSNGWALGRLHVASGNDITSATVPAQEPGSARVTIRRVNGTASISIDDVEVVTGAMPALISNVVLYYVRHKSNATTPHNFGSFEIREVKICRP